MPASFDRRFKRPESRPNKPNRNEINSAIATAAMGKGIPPNEIEQLQKTLHQMRDRRWVRNIDLFSFDFGFFAVQYNNGLVQITRRA